MVANLVFSALRESLGLLKSLTWVFVNSSDPKPPVIVLSIADKNRSIIMHAELSGAGTAAAMTDDDLNELLRRNTQALLQTLDRNGPIPSHNMLDVDGTLLGLELGTEPPTDPLWRAALLAHIRIMLRSQIHQTLQASGAAEHDPGPTAQLAEIPQSAIRGKGGV